MDAAGEDTAVADEGVSVEQAGCVAGKPDRRSPALHLTPHLVVSEKSTSRIITKDERSSAQIEELA